MKRRDEQRKRNEENGALCLGFHFFCYSNKLLDAKGKYNYFSHFTLRNKNGRWDEERIYHTWTV